MTIQEIIKQSVLALYSNKLITDTLILKGGTALSISENLCKRTSTDIDFSVSDEISNPEQFFEEIRKTLIGHFKTKDHELFDFSYSKRPSRRTERTPDFWGGYEVRFKLIPAGHGFEDLEIKRRNALMPDGYDSTIISMQISEHEFCALVKELNIDGAVVRVYEPALLILEKLRAICQQHPGYPHAISRNRARDYYDIYQLVKKHRSGHFYSKLKDNLGNVFSAKGVGLDLVDKIFEEDFIQFQKDGFEEVKKTVSVNQGLVEDFDFYVEQLKILVDHLR